MLDLQRHRFEIPPSVAYLNCAYMGPQLRASTAAGLESVRRKASPWILAATDFFEPAEALRSAVATLFGASGDDIALIPSVSYGVETAARNIPGSAGQKVVVLAEQFPSHIYAWRAWAERVGGTVCTVPRRPQGWTAGVLQAIDSSTAAVAVPGCHWTDGSLVDLQAVSRRAREVGAALVLDLTQSLGAVPFSAAAIQPDFAVAAAYKWLLGPYSLAYLYVSPSWQTRALPLENNWINRANARDFAALVRYCDEFQPGARRFDVGEKSNFVLLPIAQAAVEQLLAWTPAAIAEALQVKTARMLATAIDRGFTVLPAEQRSPHMLGLRHPNGLAPNLLARLAQKQVYVSVRGDSIRVSPHLYNDEGDEARLWDALTE